MEMEEGKEKKGTMQSHYVGRKKEASFLIAEDQVEGKRELSICKEGRGGEKRGTLLHLFTPQE